jgi:hypothetical protein
MQQIGVLHTLRATSDAAAFVRGFQAEGYAVPWDPEAGGMMAIGAADPAPSACYVVLWTRDAVTSRWVLQYAKDAFKRGILVEVLLEDVASPFNGEPPIDFSRADADKREARALWKELVRRIESKAGQPTGNLPLKKQIEPVAYVGALTFVVASTMASMGPGVQPTSQALLAPPTNFAALPEVEVAAGGPIEAPVSLTATPTEETHQPVKIRRVHYDTIFMPRMRVTESGEIATAANDEPVQVSSLEPR